MVNEMSEVPKLYFIGEFGFAFRQLLPFLEDHEFTMEIVTWKQLCCIIELLWPGKYTLIEAESIIGDIDGGFRQCTHFLHEPSIRKLESLGYKHFFSIDPHQEYFFDNSIYRFHVLKKKICYGEQSERKRFVSIFPRKRSVEEFRNSELSEQLRWIKKNYPNHKIIGHGLKSERFDIGIDYVDNVYDQINVFNNSEFLLTTPSGLADFSLACGCGLLMTGPYATIEQTNPHGCLIRYWDEVKMDANDEVKEEVKIEKTHSEIENVTNVDPNNLEYYEKLLMGFCVVEEKYKLCEEV